MACNTDILIKKIIREYIDRMTADAMRSLGTIEEPSQLARDTHRYRSRSINGKGDGIEKNIWMIHITTPDIGKKIIREGFKSSIKDLNFRATQDIEIATEMSENGLCFACDLLRDDTWYAIIQWLKESDEEWCGVIFRGSGFNAFSRFGDLNEIVFSAKSAHNMCLLLPMTEEEESQYLEYNPIENFEGVKIVDRNGKTILRGDMERLFYSKYDSNNDTISSKAENWLDNAQIQYQNKFAKTR